MSTIHIQSEIPLETLLQGVSQLDTNHLEQFAHDVLALRAQRRAPHLPPQEAELLQQINEAVLAPPLQQRLQALLRQRKEGLLTDETQQELIDLMTEVEEKDAQRIILLAELAQLRGVSLREVMEQLGLRPTYA